MKKKLLLLTIGGVILDQLCKLLITIYIPVYATQDIIPHFFYLTNVHNIGAAWSILSGYQVVLIIIGITVLLVLYYFFVRHKELTLFEVLTYGMLAGGIIGNLIDRLLWGHVIDYLQVKIFAYNFPIFNLADMLIVLSVIAITIKSIEVDYRCRHSK